MTRSTNDSLDPSTVGSPNGPAIADKPYKILFEANKCIGAGRCAEMADNWTMDITTGLAKPTSFFIGEDELNENIRAAHSCPAKKNHGVIHVIDRRTGKELAPDPAGDGTISVDW